MRARVNNHDLGSRIGRLRRLSRVNETWSRNLQNVVDNKLQIANPNRVSA